MIFQRDDIFHLKEKDLRICLRTRFTPLAEISKALNDMVAIPTNRNHVGIGLGCSRQLITQRSHTAMKQVEVALLFNRKEPTMAVMETMLIAKAAKRKRKPQFSTKESWHVNSLTNPGMLFKLCVCLRVRRVALRREEEGYN